MELLERGSLDDRLTKIGKLPEKEVLDIGIQRHRIGGDSGDLPRQLVFTLQAIAFRMNFNVVQNHDWPPQACARVR